MIDAPVTKKRDPSTRTLGGGKRRNRSERRERRREEAEERAAEASLRTPEDQLRRLTVGGHDGCAEAVRLRSEVRRAK